MEPEKWKKRFELEASVNPGWALRIRSGFAPMRRGASFNLDAESVRRVPNRLGEIKKERVAVRAAD
jgi:hypothetical protein